MVAALHRLMLEVFRRLPRRVRRVVVRTVAPSFTAGAICVIERADGRILLVRQRYRNRWGLPGGLLGRGEQPADAARREVREEVGLDIELTGPPVLVLEAEVRRIDIVFRAGALEDDGLLDAVTAQSPEIVDVGWFPPDDLPDLQDETGTALSALGSDRAVDR